MSHFRICRILHSTVSPENSKMRNMYNCSTLEIFNVKIKLEANFLLYLRGFSIYLFDQITTHFPKKAVAHLKF